MSRIATAACLAVIVAGIVFVGVTTSLPLGEGGSPVQDLVYVATLVTCAFTVFMASRAGVPGEAEGRKEHKR